MNGLSDSESSNSDSGRRYKTESTRAREEFSSRSHQKESAVERSPYRHHAENEHRHQERSYSKYSDDSRKCSKRYDKQEMATGDSKRKDSREHKSHNSHSSRTEREKDRSRSHRERSRSSSPYRSHSSHKKSSRSERTTTRYESEKESKSQKSEKHKKHKKDKHKNRDEGKHTTQKDRRASDEQMNDVKQSPKEIQNLESVPIDDDDVTICGPSLPPHMLKVKQDQSNDVDADAPVNIIERPKTYGPTLPSNFTSTSYSEEQPVHDSSPPHVLIEESDDDDDDDFIGPVLADTANKSEKYLRLEERALKLRLAKLDERESKGDEKQGREEWMTELPDLRTVADLGVTARQFRTKERDEIKDRGLWTETPREKADGSKRKEMTNESLAKMHQQEIERGNIKRRDAEQEAAIRKHKKKHKRDESLLKIHQKSMKKSTSESTSERRPFNREEDLKVNRFDDAQKKSVIKKAQLLDTRFSSGQSKYL